MKLSETQYESLSVSGVAYDTIWSLALGLDYTAKRVTQKNDSGCENLFGDLVPLEEFNYTNQKMGCIMKSGLAELEFKGVTVSCMSAVYILHRTYICVCIQYYSCMRSVSYWENLVIIAKRYSGVYEQ